MKKIFTLIAAAVMTLTANADNMKWDFTNWSATTVANLKADKDASQTTGWSDCEKADKTTGEPTVAEATIEKCYWNAGDAAVSGALTANGVAISELAGLEFGADAKRGVLAIATDYAETSLGTYKGGQYLWFANKTTYFVIKNVAPGSTIKMGIESHKATDGRGVQLSINGENLGDAFTPTTYAENTWTVPAGSSNVDVKVQATNGCHLYYIDVQDPNASSLTLDDIIGTYNSSYSYRHYQYGSGYWDGYAHSGLTITKVDDTHVMIKGLAGGNVDVPGTVDLAARTITLDDQALVADYYNVVAPINSEEGSTKVTEETKPAVATIAEDGSIYVEYDEIYGGYWYYGYKETLKKVKVVEEWSVEGTLDYYGSDQSKVKSFKATLTKYSGADYAYELTYGDPEGSKTNPTAIQFNVNYSDEYQQDTLALANGYWGDSQVAWFYYPCNEIYVIKVYTGSYSGFTGDATKGNLYMWAYHYETKDSQTNENQGYLDFNWGTDADAINNVNAAAASDKAIKSIKDGKVVITKNGKNYTVAGQMLK